MTIFAAAINNEPSWKLVMDGVKTQTRRPVKPYDELVEVAPNHASDWWRMYRDGRVLWETGREYAIQPARTMPAIYVHPGNRHYLESAADVPHNRRIDRRSELKALGYIPAKYRILSIRREDVRDISHEDAVAEGFANPMAYIEWWTNHYDRAASFYSNGVGFCYWKNRTDKWLAAGQDEMLAHLRQRPKERYDCWVIEFTRAWL